MSSAPQSLAATRDALLSLPAPFTRKGVERTVAGLRPTLGELEPYLNFSAAGYTRTLFYGGPRFEILVLCWESGQASPIHDHAASICSMAVVEGTCVAEDFTLAGGKVPCGVDPGESIHLVPGTAARNYSTGELVTVVGGDIHRVGNPRGSGKRLITVHFYLPAIPAMRCFDPDTGACWISEPRTLQPRA